MPALHQTVLLKSTPYGEIGVVQCGMAEDAAIRLENFKALCRSWDQEFRPSVCAQRLWGTAQQWSDLYHGRKSFGEKLARRIEDHLGLPRLWLDGAQDEMRGLSADLLARLAQLPEPDRLRAENVLRMHLDMPAVQAVGAEAAKPSSRKRTGTGG